MQNPRLASRYAKSILDLAIERGQLEQVYRDMQYLDQLVKGSHDFLSLLRSPVIAPDKKIKVIEMITSGNISDMTSAFIRLLVSKNRENTLPEMISSYIQQYKQKKDIHVVTLTTAAPVSEDIRKKIIAQVEKTSNMKNIELQSVVKPEIIGGFILQTGDKLVDASIAYDLKEISRQFENNDFIYKVK